MDHIKAPKVEHVGFVQGGWPIASTSTRKEPERERPGTLHITPHHLIFAFDGPANGEPEFWLPLPILSNLTLHPPTSSAIIPLVARTRTFSAYTFLFRNHTKASEVWESVKGIVSSTTSLSALYSFAQGPDVASPDSLSSKQGWSLYKPEEELYRMGAMPKPGTSESRSEAWRWTDVNHDFEFCSTYPAKLAVPSKISDVTLRYGKTYRSKARVPALVYLHWANLGSITRSSQPMVGLKNARSIQDEKLIEAIFHSHTQHSISDSTAPTSGVYGAKAANLIIDARPTTNAVANSVKGAGTENMEHYKDCKKAYLGIDNIHVMRESLRLLTDAVRDSESTGHVDRQALRRSGWLRHLSAILEGAVLIAKNVHVANSHVLVHCSDGWDRTAQLSAIAQLCLDPFYRTIKGFAILIEKDWLSFGHKFAHRAGHLVPDRTNFVSIQSDAQSAQAAFLASVQKNLAFSSSAFKETSPVFHQYLDCVYQIMRQYPKRFEFDSRLLEMLFYHLYSCQFGTFLYNSESERRNGPSNPADTTRSVWELFFTADGSPKAEYLNAQYDSKLDDPEDRSVEADQGVLLPNPAKVAFWHEVFHKTEEEMNAADLEESPPAIIEVESSADDPVVSIIEGTNSGMVDNINAQGQRKVENGPVRSSSPAYGSSAGIAHSAAAPVQFQNAVQSVWKFGGSSWKSLRSTYQEAVKDFNGPTSPTSTDSPQAQPSRQPRTSALEAELGTRSTAPRANGGSRPVSQAGSRAGSAPSSPGKSKAELPSLPAVTKPAPSPISSQAPASASNPWKTDQQSNSDVRGVQNLRIDDGQAAEESKPDKPSTDPLGVGL